MNKFFLFTIAFLFSTSFIQAQKTISFAKSTTLYSKLLNEKRTINVYLPENYNVKDTVRYPVIYIIDGGVEEDFYHISGIVRFNTQPWINRFPKSIVVGIENTDRRRDCSFAVDNLDFITQMGFNPAYFKTAGGSENYISFIEKELQPYINKTYSTNQKNTLIGESFAGLLATEILLKKTSLFDTYIIMSPSLWWGEQQLLKDAPELLQKKKDATISVYIGACNEDEDKMMFDDALTLSNLLKEFGSSSMNVYFDYLPEETHATMIHQAVYNAFKLIYPQTAILK